MKIPITILSSTQRCARRGATAGFTITRTRGPLTMYLMARRG
jgi:hypothetical protein